MTKTRIALLALIALLVLPGASLAHRSKTETVKVAGLERPTKVLRDKLGVPHVFAKSEHDAYFMVGYLHAQDRLFQMDSSRRQASGTLAELLGSSALGSDVQLRTLGLRRAAVRSQAAISPESTAVLEAYAKGVNAWIATNPLPSEYAALELTKANVPRVDCARLAGGHEAARVRPLVRHGRHREHPAAAHLPGGRRCGRLRRTEAVLRGRHAQRAVRARALDPSG